MRKIIYLIFFLLRSLLAIAQEDKDIKSKDVPEAVKKYIASEFPEATKLKFYKEVDGDSTFYEANFFLNKKEYNLLLNQAGYLKETEIVIDFNTIPPDIKARITLDLKERFDNYKIETTEEVNPGKTLQYELEVRGKNNGHSGYYELYYNSEGSFLQQEEKIIESIPNNSGF